MFTGDLAAAGVGVVFFAIPIVAILARHQQKMAFILRAPAQDDQRLVALQEEVRQLREQVSMLVLQNERNRFEARPELEKRLEQTP